MSHAVREKVIAALEHYQRKHETIETFDNTSQHTGGSGTEIVGGIATEALSLLLKEGPEILDDHWLKVSTSYHNNLLDAHLDWMRMKNNHDRMKEKFEKPLSWRERITGRRIPL